jgi:hypothetical protein
VIALDPHEIARLTVEEGGRTFSVAREPFSADRRQAILETFANLRATSFTHAPLPKEHLRRLRAGGVTLEVAAVPGDGCRGRTDGPVFELSPADCQSLLQPLAP